MMNVSVLIPTLNEEKNIRACVQSVRWAGEIFVVDSYSSDGTVKIAEELGCTVEKREFDDYSSQKNWALNRLKNDWVLWLDADERAEEGLENEIAYVIDAGPQNPAYEVNRRNYFMGREIRHGSWGREKIARFFDRRRARFEGTIHESLAFDGTAGVLNGAIRHHTFDGFGEYVPRVYEFAERGARSLYEKGRKPGIMDIAGRPVHHFIKNYLIRLGLLDGLPGFMIGVVGAYQVFLKYSILWEMNNAGGDE